jgi:hypothetical protein
MQSAAFLRRDPVMNRPLSEWERWVGLRGAPELLSAVSEGDLAELGLQDRLRKTFDPDLVRTAFTLLGARQRAVGRFVLGSEMWFDRVGLEQATGEAVALHKASRFEDRVWDLCCGIGGDAIALGGHCDVVAVDRDPGRALCCRWNVDACGVGSRVGVVVGDIKRMGGLSGLVHIDPDQRQGGGRRSHRIEDAEPGREYLEQLSAGGGSGGGVPGGAIKLSPAANFLGKFAGCEIELISVGRECKQAVIWFGDLAGRPPVGQPQLFRATSLPANETLEGHPLSAPFRLDSPGEFLLDPDPAVVRAGLVDRLAEVSGGWRLDDREEYLSAGEPSRTSLAQCFRIETVTANKPKAIREAARAAGFGPIEIKCRHVPVNAEALRRKLKLDGDRPGVVIVAKIAGKTRAVIAHRVVG